MDPFNKLRDVIVRSKEKSDESTPPSYPKPMENNSDPLEQDLQDLEMQRYEKDRVGLLQNYTQHARARAGDKADTTFIVRIDAPHGSVPLVYYFLSEISAIGLKSRHQSLPMEEFQETEENQTKMIELMGRLHDKLSDDSKSYELTRKALEIRHRSPPGNKKEDFFR